MTLDRATLQPKLVHLIAGLRHHQVEEAVALLLDYIDHRDPLESLRDYFATTASAAEVNDLLASVPLVDVIVQDGSGKRITRGLPDNARQIARYMHADAMLKARAR